MIEITEQDIHDDAARQGRPIDDDFHETFVQLWRDGLIYAMGRDKEGFLIWQKTPGA